MSGGWGGGKGSSDGGGGGGGGSSPPFWGNGNGGPNDCEPKAEPQDLSHQILAPAGGASYRAGEQVTVSWQSGERSEALRIDGPPWAGGFHPSSWQWSAFLRPEAEGQKDVTIMENQNFTFGYDVAWKVLDDCTNTAVNQTWTIPADLGGGEDDEEAPAVYKVVVVNVTDPDPGSQSSTTGPAFTIVRGAATAAASGASAPTSGSRSESSDGTATAPLSPATSTPNAPEPEQQGQEDQGDGQGLSTGAKAGIGAGVGASALFFLLTLFLLFWKRWRRRRRPHPPGETERGRRPDVELEGDGFDPEAKAEKAKTGPVLEAEAPVPGELPAVNHADFEYSGQGKDAGGVVEGNEKFRGVGADFHPSGPVEMPANEVARAELPESPHR